MAAQAAAGAAGQRPLANVEAIIVGAGPSGLLLAYRLLAAGARVELFEGRGDPRSSSGATLEGRAYALGLGIRGRTAIRTAGSGLWEAVKLSGFGSDRFQLHLPFGPIDLRTPDDEAWSEPSLLIYQTDLCGAMLNELELRFGASGRFRATFGARIEAVDALTGTVSLAAAGSEGPRELGPASVVAGCDGVNSVVRAAIQKACAGFELEKVPLPGNLKVIRFSSMPSALDSTAVHAIPGSGGSSAFLEPTAKGVCALINWREAAQDSQGGGDKKGPAAVDLSAVTDPEEARAALAAKFPLLADVLDLDAGKQFVAQSPSRAATVRCNTYHHGKAVLLGDAAHSTGGATGQGCNCALQDAAALADILIEKCAQPEGVEAALLTYSQKRVPEGQALLDLSVGPGPAAGALRKGLYGLATLRDTLLSRFGLGEPVLQTQLTTQLTPFAEIRRRRDFYFGDFPSDSDFEAAVAKLAVGGK